MLFPTLNLIASLLVITTLTSTALCSPLRQNSRQTSLRKPRQAETAPRWATGGTLNVNLGRPLIDWGPGSLECFRWTPRPVNGLFGRRKCSCSVTRLEDIPESAPADGCTYAIHGNLWNSTSAIHNKLWTRSSSTPQIDIQVSSPAGENKYCVDADFPDGNTACYCIIDDKSRIDPNDGCVYTVAPEGTLHIKGPDEPASSTVSTPYPTSAPTSVRSEMDALAADLERPLMV